MKVTHKVELELDDEWFNVLQNHILEHGQNSDDETCRLLSHSVDMQQDEDTVERRYRVEVVRPQHTWLTVYAKDEGRAAELAASMIERSEDSYEWESIHYDDGYRYVVLDDEDNVLFDTEG